MIGSQDGEQASGLEIACGRVTGRSAINKFGRTTNADNGIATDVWDRANVANNQPIWLAPTAARIHTIASTSASDVTGGVGANSVVVSYLPDWDTAEATETVTGNLNAGIAMTNAAVMIHRMRVVPQATSTSANVGTITATAADDATVTAQIEPGCGQTQMAIYGVPSVQTVYIGRLYANEVNAAGGNENQLTLLFNPNPDVQTLVYLIKDTLGIRGAGVSALNVNYYVPKKLEGPGIIKMQTTADADNMDVTGGFDLVLINN